MIKVPLLRLIPGYVAEPKCMYYVENYYVVIVQLPIVRTCRCPPKLQAAQNKNDDQAELIYDQIKIT